MSLVFNIGGIVIQASIHVGHQLSATIKTSYGKKCGVAANFNRSCSVGQRMEEQIDQV